MVGTQSADSADFAVLREVGTGSWGRSAQDRGYRTEMRLGREVPVQDFVTGTARPWNKPTTASPGASSAGCR